MTQAQTKSPIAMLIEKAAAADDSGDAMRFSQAACNAGHAAKLTSPSAISEDKIKHMVDRFLGWKLPHNFSPDDGISFDAIQNRGNKFEKRREPVGTNLLDATQATAMVRYMVEGLTAQ